jgi:ketosteroid isomerase-like protein
VKTDSTRREEGRKRTLQSILAAVVLAALPSISALASDEADVMLIAREWADTFGNDGFSKSNAPCTDDAVVIDDLPPHVWQGPGACSKWYQAVQAWAATANVTHATITLGATSHLEINSGYTYLVAPVTLSFLKGGKPGKDLGIVTMSLRKADSGWRISGLSWADQ